MSDYAWFAIKGMVYLCLIGFAVWFTKSAMPLWALLLMPSFTDNKDEVETLKGEK